MSAVEYTPVERLRQCGQACLGLSGVETADVLDVNGRAPVPVLELVVAPGFERVPPRVLRTLAEWDCGVIDVTTRGQPAHFVVVARATE